MNAEESITEILKYTAENDKLVLLAIIGFILFISFIPLFRKTRNTKLLKTVTTKKRGTKAERNLVLKLLKYGIPAQAIFHDLYIKKSNGKFSQIDIVIATKEGIIVFEVKDYSGWIFGNGKHSHWTKVLAYGKRKYRFYNPIMQNKTHIKSLKTQLKQFEKIPFYSIVVFCGDCELKEIHYVPKGTFIVKYHRIFEVLRMIKENNEPAHYTNKKEVVHILKQAVVNGENINNQNQHIEDIKDILGTERIFK